MDQRNVTIDLTLEQKTAIHEALGLYWDEVTFDADLGTLLTDDMFAVDVNLVVASGGDRVETE